MIQLHIKPYCQNCGRFRPQAVTQNVSTLADEITRKFDTFVVCEHSSECAAMVDYLKKEEKHGSEIF